MQLFSYLLTSDNLSGKYQKPQSIKAANEMIAIFNEWFDTDVSLWHNEHEDDNSTSRHHILYCLENILNKCTGKSTVPIEEISLFLNSYLEKITAGYKISEFPVILGDAPYGQTECFIGREEISDRIVELLINNEQCYLHGIRGIGKTEIAKDVFKKIHKVPSSETKITHILWVDYVENRALGFQELSLNKVFQ